MAKAHLHLGSVDTLMGCSLGVISSQCIPFISSFLEDFAAQLTNTKWPLEQQLVSKTADNPMPTYLEEPI